MNIPEEWKLVPVEPTKEMYAQFLGYDGTQYTNAFDKEHFIEDWERMLAAVPQPPPQKDEPVAELVAHTERKHALIKITKRSTTYLALGTPLYIHPDNSELRKAAERVIHCWRRENWTDGMPDLNTCLKWLNDALEERHE